MTQDMPNNHKEPVWERGPPKNQLIPPPPPRRNQPPCTLEPAYPQSPAKLVQKIQAGEYVDMAELLPGQLGVNAGLPVQGDNDEKKSKHRQVTNILEWIQCYTIYMVVRAEKQPEKNPRYAGLPGDCR